MNEEELNEIRESELKTAIEAAENILSILQEYGNKNKAKELAQISPIYFKKVAILHNALIRIGMCDYLTENK